jgi:hypothetical protein
MAVGGTALLAAHCGSSGSSKGGEEGDGGTSSGATSGGSGGTSSGATSSGVTSSGTTSTSSGGTSSGVTSSSGTTSGGINPDAGPVGTNQSVLQHGYDLYRTNTFNQPGLTLTTAPMMAPDATFNTNATFPANGNLQNQGTAGVLYIEDGPAGAGCPAGASGTCKATTRPAGNGLFLAFPAVNSNPNAVAFDETTGEQVWSAHVTTGGDGIRGTPVIDPVSRSIYAVSGNGPHLVHKIAVDTGVETTTGGWPVTLTNNTVSYNGTQFNSSNQNQHGALLFMNDILYIPFGGEYGDGGTYNGWIIAVNTTANPPAVAGWTTQSSRSGIWGSGGLASDGTGSVFGCTGDTTVGGNSVQDATNSRPTSDSEECVRVTGMAAFTRSAANVFVPMDAINETWDKPAHDLDYGASTPAYAVLPAGSNPPAVLVSPAKGGHLYILNGTNLSNGTYDGNRTPGGELKDFTLSSTESESIYTAPTLYQSASGYHATINVGGGAQSCPGGNPGGQEAIISLLIPANPANSSVAWCASNPSGGGHNNYPPISTTSDGVSANAIVWFMDGGQLEALNGDTGAKILTTTGAACNGIPSMSWPIAVKNRIVVFALGQLCSWSVNGT